MSNDNAYREFREAYSDVLADRHLDLPRLARLDRLFVRGHVDPNDPRYAVCRLRSS